MGSWQTCSGLQIFGREMAWKNETIIPWNYNLIEDVIEMWKTMSGSEIATAIGFPGHRNAVIGKMHRMGIKKDPSAPTYRPHKERPPKPKKEPLPWNGPRARDRKPEADRSRLQAEPKLMRTPLLEARFGQCRWLVSAYTREPRDMIYCGCKTVTGTSFCEFHYRKAFTFRSPQARLQARQRGVHIP